MASCIKGLGARPVLIAVLAAVLLIALLVPLAGCGGQSSTESSTSTTLRAGGGSTTISGLTTVPEVTSTSATRSGANEVEVRIKDSSFDPKEVTIKAGDSVRWVNLDSISHTVAADNGGFKSGMIAESQIFVQTFTKAGTYAYHCSIHPATMSGVVIVK